MEATMYPADTNGAPESNSVKQLKRNMTLDFSLGSSTKARKLATVLQSPDLNMLKLASPELEKMIIQANGLVTTTPTPTQFIFPKFVTEEQEAYARGFVDALAQLHRPGDPNPPPSAPSAADLTKVAVTSSSNGQFPPNSAVTYASLPVTTLQQLSTTTTLPNGVVLSSAGAALPESSVASSVAGGATHVGKASLPSHVQHAPAPVVDIRLPKLEEEPQTVPCLSSSPPLSPINMESQERIKLERKRARNRVAARKCRTRKLERIARLEDRVKELKGQNGDLLTTATSLREQVMKLKQQIVEHVNSGCQIMVTQNLNL